MQRFVETAGHDYRSIPDVHTYTSINLYTKLLLKEKIDSRLLDIGHWPYSAPFWMGEFGTWYDYGMKINMYPVVICLSLQKNF